MLFFLVWPYLRIRLLKDVRVFHENSGFRYFVSGLVVRLWTILKVLRDGGKLDGEKLRIKLRYRIMFWILVIYRTIYLLGAIQKICNAKTLRFWWPAYLFNNRPIVKKQSIKNLLTYLPSWRSVFIECSPYLEPSIFVDQARSFRWSNEWAKCSQDFLSVSGRGLVSRCEEKWSDDQLLCARIFLRAAFLIQAGFVAWLESNKFSENCYSYFFGIPPQFSIFPTLNESPTLFLHKKLEYPYGLKSFLDFAHFLA